MFFVVVVVLLWRLAVEKIVPLFTIFSSWTTVLVCCWHCLPSPGALCKGKKLHPPTPLPPFPPSLPSLRPPAPPPPPRPLVFTWPCLDGCKLHCSRAGWAWLFFPCASPAAWTQSCILEVQQTDAASGVILMSNVWLKSGPGHRCKCSSPQKTQTRMTLLAFWNKIQTHRRLKRMLFLLVVFCLF